MSLRTLTCLRHTKTTPFVKGADDRTSRNVTPEGKDVALARRAKMGEPNFDLIIVSTGIRTSQTADIVANNNGTVETVVLDELYPGGDDLGVAFEKLKYSPYSAYVGDSEGICVVRHGGVMAQALARELAKHSDKKNILVVGHAVVLTAMVCEMEQTNVSAKDNGEIMDYPLKECEGYTMILDEKNNIIEIHFIRD